MRKITKTTEPEDPPRISLHAVSYEIISFIFFEQRYITTGAISDHRISFQVPISSNWENVEIIN